MARRRERVNELLREVVAEIVTRELKDPRLDLEMLSIAEVRVSPDLRHARVQVSVLGSAEERSGAIAALNHGQPFIRRLLKPRLAMKSIPELRFELDDRLERDQAMLSFMDRVAVEDGTAGAPGAPTAPATE